jgi:deoxyadenosine/deoxycytidine kinase
MHIAIAGNIGSGKTTLTRLLAHRYKWIPRFEPVDNNPYLEDFYHDMERWSFNLQIYFLNKRFKEVVEISKSKETIVQDRTIFEDARIFAPNLHDQGLMSDRDFQNYSDLFDLMMSLVKHTHFGRADTETRQGIRAVDAPRLPERFGATLRTVDCYLQGPTHHH